MLRSLLSHLSLVPREEPPPSDDAIWKRLRREADEAYAGDPALAPLFLDSIIGQPSIEAAISHRVATRLRTGAVALPIVLHAFNLARAGDPTIGAAMRADIAAVLDRDPACERFIEPFLYFKGFHAIQAHRLTHWLWHNGRRDFALYLQSRSSELFQTDIHPAARFGSGIFLDHATGLVVGATAVIDDNVSLLQDVTLGGTGKQAGDRHPKIHHDVMIGAGATILGNIEIGEHARIAAGSVVLHAVPPYATVAGVPAKIVHIGGPNEPTHPMDQVLSDLSYDSFAWTI
jgi:serine O-acetyltransferase